MKIIKNIFAVVAASIVGILTSLPFAILAYWYYAYGYIEQQPMSFFDMIVFMFYCYFVVEVSGIVYDKVLTKFGIKNDSTE